MPAAIALRILGSCNHPHRAPPSSHSKFSGTLRARFYGPAFGRKRIDGRLEIMPERYRRRRRRHAARGDGSPTPIRAVCGMGAARDRLVAAQARVEPGRAIQWAVVAEAAHEGTCPGECPDLGSRARKRVGSRRLEATLSTEPDPIGIRPKDPPRQGLSGVPAMPLCHGLLVTPTFARRCRLLNRSTNAGSRPTAW